HVAHAARCAPGRRLGGHHGAGVAGVQAPPPHALRMDERAIAPARLAAHRLAGEKFGSIGAVLAHLLAIQSQEYAVAKWSVGQRATGISDADLDRALGGGSLVRTHVLRPTW